MKYKDDKRFKVIHLNTFEKEKTHKVRANSRY